MTLSLATLRKHLVLWEERGKPVAVAITSAFVVLGFAEGAFLASAVGRPDITVGLDYRLYLERAADWLTTGTFYLPHQLAGPYTITFGDAMYPPTLLYLLIPFTFLPPVLWWVIPLAIIGWSIRHSPWWAWPLLAALLVYPRTWAALLYGTPSIWVFAFLAAGWSALAMLKPTLAPVALLGMGHRRWWVTVAVLVVVTLPLPWMDYLTALSNARNEFGFAYLFGELPIALVLFVASHDPARAVPGRAS